MSKYSNNPLGLNYRALVVLTALAGRRDPASAAEIREVTGLGTYAWQQGSADLKAHDLVIVTGERASTRYELSGTGAYYQKANPVTLEPVNADNEIKKAKKAATAAAAEASGGVAAESAVIIDGAIDPFLEDLHSKAAEIIPDLPEASEWPEGFVPIKLSYGLAVSQMLSANNMQDALAREVSVSDSYMHEAIDLQRQLAEANQPREVMNLSVDSKGQVHLVTNS